MHSSTSRTVHHISPSGLLLPFLHFPSVRQLVRLFLHPSLLYPSLFLYSRQLMVSPRKKDFSTHDELLSPSKPDNVGPGFTPSLNQLPSRAQKVRFAAMTTPAHSKKGPQLSLLAMIHILVSLMPQCPPICAPSPSLPAKLIFFAFLSISFLNAVCKYLIVALHQTVRQSHSHQESLPFSLQKEKLVSRIL